MRLLAAAILAASFNAQAADWQEAVSGDLSNDRLNPSQRVLTAGSNLVTGGFGQPDVDYLSVVVPSGHVLSALRYGDGNVIGGVRSFIGVQAGSVMTVPADADNADGLLGWAHFQQTTVGTDLLPEIGGGFGATGFTGPLPAGTYTFWIQDTSAEPGLTFAFDFSVSTVPEPKSWILLMAGVFVASFALRRPD